MANSWKGFFGMAAAVSTVAAGPGEAGSLAAAVLVTANTITTTNPPTVATTMPITTSATARDNHQGSDKSEYSSIAAHSQNASKFTSLTSSNSIASTKIPINTPSNSSSSSSSSISSPSGTATQPSKPAPVLNNRDVVITSLIAGATAGALAKTTIAPLDRTKINFQINKDIPYSFRAAMLFLKDTYTKEGFFALWRGNSATMVRIIPYSAIQFTAHEQWKKILQVDMHDDTKLRRFMAGALAGITSQSLTYPLDLARARMAVTDKYSGYKTLREVFVKIWQCEGPRTLFRGYWATILGVIPYAGTSFFTYDTLKKEYYKRTGDSSPNTVISLAFGAAAGMIGQSSSYPLDIVRRRMQTTGVTAQCADRYLTIGTTLGKIYREEGFIRGFYKGLSMNWIKGPIAVGISFATYDHIKHLLRELMQLER